MSLTDVTSSHQGSALSWDNIKIDLNSYPILILDADPMLGEELWQVLELVQGDSQHL